MFPDPPDRISHGNRKDKRACYDCSRSIPMIDHSTYCNSEEARYINEKVWFESLLRVLGVPSAHIQILTGASPVGRDSWSAGKRRWRDEVQYRSPDRQKL